MSRKSLKQVLLGTVFLQGLPYSRKSIHSLGPDAEAVGSGAAAAPEAPRDPHGGPAAAEDLSGGFKVSGLGFRV